MTEQESTAVISVESEGRNAFNLLMSSQHARLQPSKIPPKPGGELHGDFKLMEMLWWML